MLLCELISLWTSSLCYAGHDIDLPTDHIHMQAHFDEDIQISGFQKFSPKGKVNFYTQSPKVGAN